MIKKIFSDIKRLKIQGARAVAQAAVNVIELTIKTSRAKNGTALVKEVERVGLNLSKIRPTEPALRNAVTKIVTKMDEVRDRPIDVVKKVGLKAAADYKTMLISSQQAIAEIGSGLIKDGDTILTHCHSSAVLAIFRRAAQQGKKFTIVVTETRPLYQGLITANEALRAKIKVIYCTDSAIGWFMKKVDKVIVGCDAILADGSIVNKIGTLPIAIVAEKFGVPVYVAGGAYKFDPQTILGVSEPIEQRPAKEIVDPKKIKGAKIVNPAFDIVPAEFIRALITEKGIVKPELVRQLGLE
jgi:ribose 1,5-bisphosphate isomerase